uniref:Pleckstrin homology domain-containing family M member 1 n=1 Tax=Lygus hesperus TaxID=30085 RepID=A0A0A9ZHN1_LYGHE
MTSFFQNMKARTRETLVKDSLTKALNEAVKNVQLNKTLIENDAYVTSEDAGKSLLVALEAIFIHGVKESFAEKFSSAFGDPDRMPAPEFWTPMMIFTPRHTISQVMNYAQIANDVGRSRSWIRACLNDGFFLGYLMTIAQETKSLKPYYKTTAYLVDQERINIAISYFQGLSQFKFSFPCNSRFLNCWSTSELLMAGYCTPSLKIENLPVLSGTDIAKTLPDEDSDNSSVKSFSSVGTSTMNIDHEKALEMILSTPTEGSPLMRRLQDETKESIAPRDAASSPVKFLEENPVETKDAEEKSSEHTKTLVQTMRLSLDLNSFLKHRLLLIFLGQT